MYYMFTMTNTKYLKQLQANQIENLTNCWNSKMEVQCVKPQAPDQSNEA